MLFPLVVKQNSKAFFSETKTEVLSPPISIKRTVSSANQCAGAPVFFYPFLIRGRAHINFLRGEILTVQEVDHQLIGAHHDGGVGNLAYQVGGEAAIQGTVALLSGYCG